MISFKKYEISPSAKWVVLVHGVGGSSSIWFKQLRDFKQHFNLLLVDLRGHGRSQNTIQECLENKYTFEEVAHDVIEVMDHLNIEKGHFIGISLGTIVIRTIAEIAPNRVASMILGGAVTRLNFRSTFLMWFADQIKRFVPFLWLYSLYAFILMPRKRNRESRSLFIQEAKKLARKEIIRWFSLTAEVNPLLRYFSEREVPIPTLYIMGEEDYMFLPQVKRIIKQHRYAMLKVFKACGHVVNVEKPELFNELTVRFINNPSVSLAL